MRAINHALTGAIIGLSVSEPVVALPLAFLSHYVLDVIPHFGIDRQDYLKKWFRLILVVDALLCFLLVLVLFVTKPTHWLTAILCAFLAASPDLFSINKFIQGRRGKEWHPGWYVRFASRIQWYERPPGAIVEIVWFVGACWILASLLH